MAPRVLLVEESPPVIEAVRGPLEGAGFRVDVASAAPGLEPQPGTLDVAVIRAEAAGAGLLASFRAADPTLPVVLLLADEHEAAAGAGAAADGVLVAPLTAAGVVSCCRAMARLAALERRVRELEAAAPAPAAGLTDYQFFKRLLLMEVKRSRRHRYPIALAFAAVDRWREVAADLDAKARQGVLHDVLGVLTGAVRDIDLALLYSEDRFLVFMPHTRSDGAFQVATRLVTRVRERAREPRVTLSAGIATFEGEGAVSFAALARSAAEALAAAQAEGGDRASRLGPPPKRDRVVIG